MADWYIMSCFWVVYHAWEEEVKEVLVNATTTLNLLDKSFYPTEEALKSNQNSNKHQDLINPNRTHHY
jgi:hypothetical protein